jgi:uncharacterized membrane protein
VTQAADDRGAQRLRKGIAAVWLGLVAAVTHAATAEAGVVTVIEDTSGFVGPQVQALSADGAVAGGSDVFAAGFHWNGAFDPVPALPGGSASFVFDLSQDGSVAVGAASDGALQHPMRWTPGGGTASLGTLAPGESGGARAVSADGSVVVGRSGAVPFRWTASGGIQALTGVNGFAWDVSGAGEVVTGTSVGTVVQAYRWTQMGGMTGLGTLPGYESSSARAISSDGTTIVGSAYDEDSETEQAMRWTQSEGMVGIGSLPDCVQITATAVSGGGSLIAGECWLVDGITRRAFVWTQPTGILALADFLSLRGVAIEDPLSDPDITAVSDDGRVLAVVDSDVSGIRSLLIDVTPKVPALPLVVGLALFSMLAGFGARRVRAPTR